MKKEELSFIDIYIKNEQQVTKQQLGTSSKMGVLRRKLCEEVNVNISSLRLLIDGERVHDEDTANGLRMTNGDIIEIHIEIMGGGGPKQNISQNADKILDILDRTFDDEDQDNSTDEDEVEDLSTKKHNGSEELCPKRHESEFDNQVQVSPTSPSSKSDCSIFENNDGMQENNNFIDKQDCFDQQISFSEIHSDDFEMSGFKRLRKITIEKSNTLDSDKDSTQTQESKKQELGFTPQNRKRLISKFSISPSSPSFNSFKVTEKEMKRLSIAVHLYAEMKFGGMKTLHKKRLKGKHFEEIIEMYGPESTYDLLKKRSVLQYKWLWRNNNKSKFYFRGHPATGYETDLKLHSPSREFCPFQHCNSSILSPMSPLDIDLVLQTPKVNRGRVNSKSAAGRNLFGSQKENINNDEIHKVSLCDKESPTKEELKRQIQNLQKMNLKRKQENEFRIENTHTIDNNQTTSCTKIIIHCKAENCEKTFTSSFGLNKHMKNQHKKEKIEPMLESCAFCNKKVFWVDKHILRVHNDIFKKICEICQQKVTGDMKEHRGLCISCPTCGKILRKKKRLLDHIRVCTLNTKQNVDDFPLDLSPAWKKTRIREEEPSAKKTINPQAIIEEETDVNINKQLETENNPKSELGATQTEKGINLSTSKSFEVKLTEKRQQFSFDVDGEEFYMSELEEDDTEDFTRRRRKNKDDLEQKLREIDKIQTSEYVGDDDVLKKFKSFMSNVSNSGNGKGEFAKLQEPSTVVLYTRAIEKDVLKAFHQLFDPFDARWLLDCTTRKNCLYDGEQRQLISPEEPIYLTSVVLRKAIEKYESGGNGQQNRGQ